MRIWVLPAHAAKRQARSLANNIVANKERRTHAYLGAPCPARGREGGGRLRPGPGRPRGAAAAEPDHLPRLRRGPRAAVIADFCFHFSEKGEVLLSGVGHSTVLFSTKCICAVAAW